MSLYLKYRPRRIEELDLASVRATLAKVIEANRLSHAYLLTGPRGAGKTSTARIIARIANCEHNRDKLAEPCNECPACESILRGSAVDVIEMDAASNRGIDDIRELKQKIRLAPANLRYKVYIIDEVHMLTNEAFNALLKTLEEPPSHSLFVLCTTESHKVPETIVSRCVSIKFAKATPTELLRSLTRVVAGEGREVAEDALEYLSRAVDGSFRDGVKILEQVLQNQGGIDLSMMEIAVAGRSGIDVGPLIAALVARKVEAALASLTELVTGGINLNYLLLSLMRGLRDKLVAGQVEVEVTKLIFTLDEVARRQANSLDGVLLLQTAIVEWCGRPEKTGEPDHPDKVEKKPIEKKEKVAAAPTITASSEDVWQQLLAGLNGESITLGALLAKAVPMHLAGDELVIGVAYDFHRQQLMSEKTLVKLEKAVEKIVGSPVKIKCEIVDAAKLKLRKVSEEGEGTPEDDTIAAAVEIFSS